MASTPQPNQAERVASNARLQADGGSIFADVPNVVTSVVVIVHQVSIHRNTTPLRVTRSSRASSRTSDGFTIIVPKNSSRARSFRPLTPIHWINRCRDRPEQCLQTGKRCFTNRGGSLVCDVCYWPKADIGCALRKVNVGVRTTAPARLFGLARGRRVIYPTSTS
jgi:hypothetical protein